MSIFNLCGNCRFYRDKECRRFPPQFTMYPHDNQAPIIYTTAAFYPNLATDTPSCGEFQAGAPSDWVGEQ